MILLARAFRTEDETYQKPLRHTLVKHGAGCQRRSTNVYTSCGASQSHLTTTLFGFQVLELHDLHSWLQ